MSIQDYSYYRIQNVRGAGDEGATTGYLHVPGASMTSGTPLTQWRYSGRGVDFTDHFEFLLIEVEREAKEDKTFYIVNRRSGFCLAIDDLENGAPLKQVAWPPARPMMAQFVLKPVEGLEDCFSIASQYAGTYLVVDTTPPKNKPAFDPTRNRNPIRAYNETALPEANAGDVTQMYFTIELVGAGVPMPKLASDADGDTRDQLKRINSMSDALPRSTELVLLDFDVVPFFWISDPVYPPHRQVEVTPFYTLRRSRLWHKMYDRELDGVVERASTETMRIGMTTVDAQSFRAAFGFSLETKAEAGGSFLGIGASASVAMRLETEVEMTMQRETTREFERTTEDRITYPSIGHPYRIARWRPIDRYDLCRADDDVLYTWNVVQEGEEVIDVFPRAPEEQQWGGRQRTRQQG